MIGTHHKLSDDLAAAAGLLGDEGLADGACCACALVVGWDGGGCGGLVCLGIEEAQALGVDLDGHLGGHDGGGGGLQDGLAADGRRLGQRQALGRLQRSQRRRVSILGWREGTV